MSMEYKDNSVIEDGYFDRFNPHILKKIPVSAQKVLEIGCGAGALAEKFKEINPGCEYYGMELSVQAAEYAVNTGRINRIEVGSVEDKNIDTLNLNKNSLDCIIYGDVLEHLLDPWKIVSEHKEYLKPGGIMLASIPNISNFTIIYQLLKGQWHYKDGGLLDRTHLRFFTRTSIKQLFMDAGLVITALEGRCYFMKDHASFMRILNPILPSLGLDTNKVSNDTKVFQYIIVAEKR